MTSKDQESKNTKIPSNICLNSPEPTKDIKRIKFLTKKLITFRVDNNTKNNYPKKIKDSKNGRWTLKEHIEFLNGITKYGNDLSKIKINSRNNENIINYFLKIYKFIVRL